MAAGTRSALARARSGILSPDGQGTRRLTTEAAGQNALRPSATVPAELSRATASP